MLLATMPVTTRNILNVELVPAASSALNRVSKETGMSKKDVIAMMLAWYAAQPDEVQRIVVGRTPASLIPAAQEIAIKQIRENPLATKGKYDETLGPPINPQKETDTSRRQPRK